MRTLFEESELPKESLERLGLMKEGTLTLSQARLEALLSGRRTDFITFDNLRSDDFMIKRIEAKLSLTRDSTGHVIANLHPIYKDPKPHPLLQFEESEHLLSAKVGSVSKKYTDENGQLKSLVIEYDRETNEFVSYDPDHVLVPETVNGEPLTAGQKDKFRNGEVVELSDGTRFSYSAEDVKGIKSDNVSLILSVLLDGGISYLLLRGLSNLSTNQDLQKADNPNFDKEFDEMQKKWQSNEKLDFNSNYQSRPKHGYGKSSEN